MASLFARALLMVMVSWYFVEAALPPKEQGAMVKANRFGNARRDEEGLKAAEDFLEGDWK